MHANKSSIGLVVPEISLNILIQFCQINEHRK